MANARQYNFDVAKIVVTGDSAGSHLALTSGLATAAAGLDRQCPGPPEPKVAAIVNWFGATDVGDLLEGPNAQGFAIDWLGSRRDRAEIATRVSPLTYARPGAPPVLTVHGDADTVVPQPTRDAPPRGARETRRPERVSSPFPAAATAASPASRTSGASPRSARSWVAGFAPDASDADDRDRRRVDRRADASMRVPLAVSRS